MYALRNWDHQHPVLPINHHGDGSRVDERNAHPTGNSGRASTAKPTRELPWSRGSAINTRPSCMDERGIGAKGIDPLKRNRQDSGGPFPTRRRLSPKVVRPAEVFSGAKVFFGFGSTQDLKNSSEVIAAGKQGGRVCGAGILLARGRETLRIAESSL